MENRKSPEQKYGRYAGFEGGIWRRFWIGSQICLNFWARTKIDWDSDILHYFSVYLNGLGFFPVNFLSLVKRTIILVIFFSKFLIILAKSFENWPIFPWKTESWPFSSKFSMFSRYFSKKGLENLTNFWPICQKKISKESEMKAFITFLSDNFFNFQAK